MRKSDYANYNRANKYARKAWLADRRGDYGKAAFYSRRFTHYNEKVPPGMVYG